MVFRSSFEHKIHVAFIFSYFFKSCLNTSFGCNALIKWQCHHLWFLAFSLLISTWFLLLNYFQLWDDAVKLYQQELAENLLMVKLFSLRWKIGWMIWSLIQMMNPRMVCQLEKCLWNGSFSQIVLFLRN